MQKDLSRVEPYRYYMIAEGICYVLKAISKHDFNKRFKITELIVFIVALEDVII